MTTRFRRNSSHYRRRLPDTCQNPIRTPRSLAFISLPFGDFLPAVSANPQAGVIVNSSLQSDLRNTIADALRSDGCYVGEIDSLATQELVDAQWTAHLAARTVGTRVKVVVNEQRQPGKPARAVLHVTQRSE
jgi:hypothetical protein